MKRKNDKTQKNYSIIVFMSLFVPIIVFLLLAIFYPEFAFLTPLGLVVGPTVVLLKPDLIHDKAWKRRI